MINEIRLVDVEDGKTNIAFQKKILDIIKPICDFPKNYGLRLGFIAHELNNIKIYRREFFDDKYVGDIYLHKPRDIHVVMFNDKEFLRLKDKFGESFTPIDVSILESSKSFRLTHKANKTNKGDKK